MATAKEAVPEHAPQLGIGGRPLTVRSSDIRPGGAVRIHESVRAELGLASNTLVEVNFGKRTLALRLFADERIGRDEILLREPDMRRLGVAIGEQVEIRPYLPAAVIVREGARDLGRGIERKLRPKKHPSEGEE